MLPIPTRISSGCRRSLLVLSAEGIHIKNISDKYQTPNPVSAFEPDCTSDMKDIRYPIKDKVCHEGSSVDLPEDFRGEHITREATYMSISNKQAIDNRVTFADQHSRLLSELWHDQPLVLVFLRHLG